MYETKQQPETLKHACAALGLAYTAEFVPFSKSRNAKPVQKPSDLSLNWRITISKGSRSLTTDYMQGIGHLPKYKGQSAFGRCTQDEFKALKRACEEGRRIFDPHSYIVMGTVKLQAPALHDVMHSLLLDSEVIEHATFEDWAREYGYDTDSRKDEDTYKACLQIALKLRALIGDSAISELREAAQDY